MRGAPWNRAEDSFGQQPGQILSRGQEGTPEVFPHFVIHLGASPGASCYITFLLGLKKLRLGET